MTKLQAVNHILKAVGLYDIPSLDTGGKSEAGYIESLIDEVDLEVQLEGWHYNVHLKKELAKDGSDRVALPTGAIAMWDARNQDWMDLAQIGQYLYDLDEETNQLTNVDTVDATVVFRFSWGCIPAPVRMYIAARAAVRYAENRIDQHRQRIYVLQQREKEAERRARQFNNRSKEVNILDSGDARDARGNRFPTRWGY